MSNTKISLDELHQRHRNLEANEVILDVRRPDEFAEAHIENALNIPLDEVAGRMEELKKFKTVYIHCKRGGRAKTAFETLQSLGLENLVCIEDAGMDAWRERGYPIKN
jgi:rhodanese-related sulfurtransferase